MTGKPQEIIQWLWNQEREKTFEIKEHKETKKRSLNANAYCWVLLQKIADVLHSTKEEIYRRAIKDKGTFEILPIKNQAVVTFIQAWEGHGIGWVCEVLRDSKLDGYTNVIAYYGSSTYDTKQMANFIDYIVEEAKTLDIETLTPEQLETLKIEWR